MRRFIMFLIRRKLHVKKYENFVFSNQKKPGVYQISEYHVWKDVVYNGTFHRELSDVSLNWILDPNCKVTKV